MNKFIYLIIAGFALIAAGCTVVSFQQQAQPAQTQLQTREFQTREFDTNNTKLILKAMINVLQDDGFVIKNADADLGLLFATKEINLTKSRNKNNQDFWETFFESMAEKNKRHETDKSFNKIKIVEASINVTELGRRSKVRANFQAKILDNRGNAVDVYAVDDPKYYQNFFSKVSKGVFLEKQGF
ncbi:hypothetical protein ACFLSQ_04265 [Bacteroidota bacterium]